MDKCKFLKALYFKDGKFLEESCNVAGQVKVFSKNIPERNSNWVTEFFSSIDISSITVTSFVNSYHLSCH